MICLARLVSTSIIPLAVLLGSCTPRKVSHANNDLYSQLLDEIVTDRQIYGCGNVSQAQAAQFKEQDELYSDGRIDSVQYFEFVNEVKDALKDTVTCIFDLSGSFNAYRRDEYPLSIEEIDLMRVDIASNHIDSFLDISTNQIMDSITKPSQKTATDFKVDYIKMVPYIRTPKSFIHNMKGNGIFSFSSASMSKDHKRAAVYYEYTCGPKCGIGEIVVLQFTNDHWTIIRRLICWQS